MGKHQVQALQGPNLFIQFTPRALTKLHVRWWVKISTRKLRNFGGQFTSVRVGSPLFLTFYQQISPCKGLALGHLLFDHEYKPKVVLIHFLETCSTWLWGHHRLPCPSQQPDIIEKLFVIDLDCCKTLWKRNKYCAIDCYTNKSFVINMLTLKYKDKIIYIKANSLREIYFIIL